MGKKVVLSDKQENNLKAINKISKKGDSIMKTAKLKTIKPTVINITNLIGTVNIYGKQDAKKLQEMVTKSLVAAVNGVNEQTK